MGFEEYRLGIHRKRLGVAIFYMATPLYLGFSLLDWYFAPDLWALFLAVRGISSLIFLGIAYLLISDHVVSKNRVYTYGHLITLTLGSGIGYMSFATGGLESPYYAGLNWIAIGSLAFWPSSAKQRIISTASIYLPLIILILFFGELKFTVVSFVSLTFMVGTCVLSFMNNALSMQALLQEFELRTKLHELIEDKDRIIEKKSDEAANLKRLAKQFSPAVIEAIESRSISLTQRSRKEVAIIFMDVVESTSRSNQLDYTDYQKALDIFFNIAIKKFLEKNITVANFMGDGIMAIANAPFTVKNYERLAFETCMEIIQETKNCQRQLREYWKSDFKIRVGVSAGFANVGFFPNNDFGVYTAIGESVNLASRLCASAEPFSIAITKRIIIESQDVIEKYKIKPAGLISNLKGFTGNELEYFIATLSSEAQAQKESCPLCFGELFIAADLGDCDLIKCKNCKYSDIQNKDKVRLAS